MYMSKILLGEELLKFFIKIKTTNYHMAFHCFSVGFLLFQLQELCRLLTVEAFLFFPPLVEPLFLTFSSGKELSKTIVHKKKY